MFLLPLSAPSRLFFCSTSLSNFGGLRSTRLKPRSRLVDCLPTVTKCSLQIYALPNPCCSAYLVILLSGYSTASNLICCVHGTPCHNINYWYWHQSFTYLGCCCCVQP